MSDPPSSAFDAERLTRLGRVSGLAAAPDGSHLVCAVQRIDAEDATYVADLHRVPLDGGDPMRLTRGDHDDRAPDCRADGAVGFLSDRPTPTDPDGEGRSQVWLLPAHGGEPWPVTDEPLGVSAFRFAGAGDRLVVLAPVLPGVAESAQRETADEQAKHGPSELHYTDMPVRFWDHWEGPAAPRLLVFDGAGAGRRELPVEGLGRQTDEGEGHLHRSDLALSANGRRLAVTVHVPSADRCGDDMLVVIDLDDADAEPLRLHEPDSDIGAVVISGDGARVAWALTKRGAPDWHVVELRLLDVASGTVRVLGGELDRFLAPAAFSPDGAALYCTADDRATVPILRVDLDEDAVTARTDPALGGTHGSVAVLPDGGVVALRCRITHPPEPYRFTADLAGEPERMASLSGFAVEEGDALVALDEIEVTGPDGTAVHGMFVTPRAVPGSCPLFFWIHGGPVSAFGDTWHWRWNALLMAAQGWAVALPNARGSTGYGQQFVSDIYDNRWGGACAEDLVAFLDAVAARDDVDASRMVCMGGSFGGYMTNWLASREHRFAGYVTHASLYDLGAFQGTTDVPAFFAYAFGGDPQAPDFERYSPHRFVDDVRGPMLILHGEKDYRVPIGEALALFEQLRARDIDAEMSVFPDENHWILKPRNIRAWYSRVLGFAGRV